MVTRQPHHPFSFLKSTITVTGIGLSLGLYVMKQD